MVRRYSNKKAGVVSILLSILILIGVMGAFSSSVSASQPDEESITSLSETGWPGFGFDEKNTHQSPYDTSHVNGTLKWSNDISNRIWSSAAISEDGKLYVGSTNGDLYSIDSQNGDVLWTFETGDGIISSPAIDQEGNIYVGSQDNHLYSLYPNGTLRWEFETDGMIHSSPAISQNGTVYVGSDDTYFYGISQSGNLRWKYKADSWFWSSPAIDDDGTVYVGSGDKNLYAFNPNGTLKWNFQTGRFIYSSPAIGDNGTIYIGSYDGKLYALSPQGDKIWNYNFGDEVVSSPAIGSEGTVYIGTHGNSLHAVYPNGTHRWEFETNGEVKSSPAIGASDNIYFGSYDGHVYALDHEGNERWSYDTNWEIYASPSIGPDGDVYIGSWDSTLYAFTGSGEPPEADIEVWQEVEVNLTIAGRPGNEVTAEFYENGNIIETLTAKRTSGEPNTNISSIKIDPENNYTLALCYNSTLPGANPVWLNISSGENSSYTIFNTFKSSDDEDHITIDISEEIEDVVQYTYHFSGLNSSVQDSNITSYLWDFGDGNKEAGKIVMNKYYSSGFYTVSLEVTDDNGNIGSEEITLEVGDTEDQDHEDEDKHEKDNMNSGNNGKKQSREGNENVGDDQFENDPMTVWMSRKGVEDDKRMKFIFRAQKIGGLSKLK